MDKMMLYFGCVVCIVLLQEKLKKETAASAANNQIKTEVVVNENVKNKNITTKKQEVKSQSSDINKKEVKKEVKKENNKKYKLSKQGKNNIKKHESCSLTAYWDVDGYSIGYGHHKQGVTKGMKISQAQADKYFDEDVVWVEDAVNRLVNNLPVKQNFNQNFIDGLGDLVYNCGEGGVKSSSFYIRLQNCRKNNKADIEYAIAAVKNCCVSQPGHITRRQETMSYML